MPNAKWIDDDEQLSILARALERCDAIGVDTEFLRERTFFPKLCLLQIAAADEIWCIDTLRLGSLEALWPALRNVGTAKLIHAARQDLEAVFLTSGVIVSPVWDTQIAAGLAGFKPQIGYAELVKTLLDVAIPKGQTRTDWSKRPLSTEQLEYAADDVLYLRGVADDLGARLRALGREQWMREDCAQLSDRRLYEPDLAQSWQRLKGIAQLPAAARGRAQAIAVWREKMARDRDLPRAWILPDPAVFAIAYNNPSTPAALESIQKMHERFAQGVLDALRGVPPAVDEATLPDLRPTPEQKALIDKLNKVTDARAVELQIHAEVLAPRGEIKAIVLGKRDTHCMAGWRRDEIGERLLAALPAAVT